MKIQSLLESKLQQELQPTLLKVINESSQHNVPEGSESHFRVLIVSNAFEGLTTVKRHQRVYSVISEEIKSRIHAFSQQTFTPSEWESQSETLFSSPPCAKKPK